MTVPETETETQCQVTLFGDYWDETKSLTTKHIVLIQVHVFWDTLAFGFFFLTICTFLCKKIEKKM